jgi:hypothetical protein
MSDGSQGLNRPAVNELGILSNGTEQIRVAATGNIGIGNTAPAAALHITRSNSGNEIEYMRFSSSNTSGNNDRFSTTWYSQGTTHRLAVMSVINEGSGKAGFRFGTTNNGAVSTPDRFYISGDGNVGIGTTPSAPLHVSKTNTSGSGETELMRYSVSSSIATNDELSTNWYAIGSMQKIAKMSVVHEGSGRSGFRFGTSNNDGSSVTNRFAISGNGYVGIGTTTPAFPLDVFSTVSSAQTYGYLNPSGLVGTSVGTSNYSIRAEGRILATEFNAVSDARLKDVQFNLDSKIALDAISNLQPVSFTWKDNPTGQPVLGLLAQDVELVIPNAVSRISTGNFIDQREVSYNQIVAVMIGAVKEIKNQLALVTGQVSELMTWFGGDRFNVNGMVCVDDVCVSKEQFKQILINSGSVTVVPTDSSSSNSSSTPVSDSTPTSDPIPTLDPMSESSSTSTPNPITPASVSDSVPTPEPAPVASAPEPAPVASAPEPAPAPTSTE